MSAAVRNLPGEHLGSPSAPPGNDIAIIGMACIYPGADDLAEYWRNILARRDATGEPPPGWGAERYVDPESTLGERIYTAKGGFLAERYRFNPMEFGIMPATLDGGEPDHLLALRVARDTLADAGYLGPEVDHTRTGIILGHSTYLHRGNASVVQHGVVLDQTLALLRHLAPTLSSQDEAEIRALLKAELPPFNADIAPGLVPNVMTGRIANRLNLFGPNYIVDGACASSLLAVGAAIDELRLGRSDLMLAGGVNASIPAEVLMVFTQLEALSRSGGVRPFDANADGTLLGEGLGMLGLKRLADAERDGDRIYAVIRAVGQSSDGRGSGLLAPRLEGERLALERAYGQCDIDPASITLVEAHGTGIPLGEQTELAALREVFGPRRTPVPTCGIGSVKSMITHTIPAAGAASLIKVALALHRRILPPTLCESVNPRLGLEGSPFYISTETRPWVHPSDRPRRAAVNAFGFGGINAHCVVEEYRGGAEPTVAVDALPHELVVLTGPDREGLLGRIEAVRGVAARAQPVTLGDLAWTAWCLCDPGAPERLAIVAASVTELVTKLDKAAKQLASPARARLQTRTGIFFANASMPGELAFVFPGEGAQYRGMLADLALVFPSVRRWFDLWDALFAEARAMAPSAAVFPPPNGVDEATDRTLAEALVGLELGTESVFFASQALLSLLERFGVRPDVMVGHSTGENTALVASGMVGLDDEGALAEHIRRLNRIYRRIEDSGDGVPTGALLAVGNVARARILELVAHSAGAVHYALDNCEHQAVLFGERAQMESVAKALGAEGGLCAFLPFDRAYHTPLFEPISTAVEAFLGEIEFRPAQVDLYSCATAGRFPDEAAAARRLAAQQWSRRVRFAETIEVLYARGVRHFLEVGPSSNLTAFIDDILRERPHVAAATNRRQRSGVEQLLAVLAQLFVNGRAPDLAPLFVDRRLEVLDLEQAPRGKDASGVLLSNVLPFIALSPAGVERLRALVAPHMAAASAPDPSAPQRHAAPAPAHAEPNAEPNPEPNPEPKPETTAPAPGLAAEAPPQPWMEPSTETTGADNGAWAGAGLVTDPGARGAVLQQHLHLMEAFLTQNARVVSAGLIGHAHVEAVESVREQPFIGRVIEHTGEMVRAECDLVVARQRFLQEHILYSRVVSDFDASVHGLSVSPFTVSLEMLCEVAALIAPAPYVVGLENVRAFNWVALDEGRRRITLIARRGPGPDQDGRARVEAHLEDGDERLLAGLVVFAQSPAQGGPQLPELQAPKASHWADHELYATGMFHGPLFQSIASIEAWDETGLDAQLTETPTADLFGDGRPSQLYLNPVALDAIGHVTAFWLAQSFGTDFSSFPSEIRSIELTEAYRVDTAGARLSGRIDVFDRQVGRFLSGDYECVDADGRLLFRVSGWRDRFFSVPHRFYVARTDPRQGWYGIPLACEGLAPEILLWRLPAFPDGFLEDAGSIWKRVLAHTVLGFGERDQWRALPRHPATRRAWLLERLAAKEVARLWLWHTAGALPMPADVVPVTDSGHSWAAGPASESLGLAPALATAWLAGDVLAACAPPGTGVGLAAAWVVASAPAETHGMLANLAGQAAQRAFPDRGGTAPEPVSIEPGPNSVQFIVTSASGDRADVVIVDAGDAWVAVGVIR